MKMLLKAVKYFALGLLSVIVLVVVVYLFLPKGPRELMEFDDPFGRERPAAVAEQYMAATGNQWATAAALDALDRGGNAVDAAVAALLVLNVTFGEAASFPGVAPVLVYEAKTGKVTSYTGAGKAPAAATIELFKSRGHEVVPKLSILSQLVPASPDVITALLERYGTKGFGELAAPAIRLAEEGFPVHATMHKNLSMNVFKRLGMSILMPYNAQVYLGGQWWRPLHRRERFRRPDLAKTFRALADAESGALKKGGGRKAGLAAVRDYFYKGPVAEAILTLHREKGGLFTREDLSGYRGEFETPLSGSYGDYTLYTNRTWCQGAVVPLALQILEGVDLKSMSHNSPAYVHAVLQAIELAMADREAFFGDPAFVRVPEKGLLSKTYAAERRALMTPGRAFGAMPPHGDPWKHQSSAMTGPASAYDPAPGARLAENSSGYGRDTSYLSVIDRWGNAVSMTPSDFPQSPMVPGTGLTLGIRMTQFRLDPKHPAALAPGKRPTITPNAAMAFKKGKLYMSFGTPGGDMQTQALVQVFLNIAVFGMDVQEAIDAPRFRSLNWPDAFSPHAYRPGVIELEGPLGRSVGGALEDMGYRVEVKGERDNSFSAVCAVIRDPETGRLRGGADARESSWAEGR
ncbi:MAG: gamma-glutamyltransferase [Spirochaetes bacterium]|jgi:gamma-glutamyltranspeptidase/glutathione hydrolase|nr:gamma-glutamyltransferase [Spirochaetota bacterium]